MVKILVSNHKSRLIAPLKVKMQIRKVFAIKNKKAFWSPAFRKGQWDGYVRYMGEESGLFPTGLLYQMVKHLEDLEEEYEIEDLRESFKDLHEITELGGMEFRGYQADSVKSLLNNRYKGIRFQRGILNEATNAGKSLIAGGIYSSFSNKRKGIFLVNNKTLFEQAYPDLCKLLGKENVGRINSDHTEWKRVNVCMVQTLGIRMKKDPRYKNFLAQVDIVLVDEADELIGRKDCQSILNASFNATIRVALTGTALKHKDPLRNQEQLAFFGPILHTITNKELVGLGVSTPPDIRISLGNTHVRYDSDYKMEYERGVIKNKQRHRRIWKKIIAHSGKDRLPILILFREHKHAYSMLDEMPEEIGNLYRVSVVHHKTKNREEIFEKFNDGKIDILFASMIIKRGKNLPRIKVLINAAGGDSEVVLLQIFGRALRSHKSKKKVIIEDFWDVGKYLQRHSKHRLIYYRNQGFPVKVRYTEQRLKELNKKITIR
jgi:superfamily II DNA or RNA helicase